MERKTELREMWGRQKSFWQRNTIPVVVWLNNENTNQMEECVIALELTVQTNVSLLL